MPNQTEIHLSDHLPEPVEVLGADAVPDIVGVLGEAFHDYPVMRFVLGSAEGYPSRLDTLVRFFVEARLLREEVLLGVRELGGLGAAALVSHSRAGRRLPELDALRERTWDELGHAARSRYEAFGAATDRFALDVPHLRLNMIGVRRSARGRGLGRALMDAVHELSAGDEASNGVALTTEAEANVPFYERFGYRILGSTRVESAFTTWVMYRPDRQEPS